MKRFSSQLFSTILSQCGTMVIGLAASIVLSRVLQPEGRGVYALVLFFASIVTYSSTFGIGQAAIYYVGKGPYLPPQVVGNTLSLTLALSGASMIVGGLVILFFSGRFFPSVAPRYLWAGLLLIPLQLTSGIMTQLVLAIQNVRVYNLSRLLKGLFTLLATVILLGYWRGSVFTAIGIEIIASLFVCAQLWVVLRKEIGPLDYRVRLPYVRQAFRFGLSTYLGSTLLLFHYRVDVFLINLFMAASHVGLYSLSASLAEKITFLSDGISTLLFPRLASEKQGETANNLTPVVLRTVLYSLCGMGGVLILLGGVITTGLYGVTYAPSVTPLRILVVGTIAAGTWGILESDIKSRGFPLFGFVTTLVSAIVNIVLNCFWIPRYGIIGAASATAVSYTVSLLMGVIIYCRLSGQRGWDVLFPKKRDFLLYWDLAGRLWQGVRS